VLDTEWAGAVAPAATLLFVSCASTRTTAGIFLSAEAVIYNNLVSTMSLSYGEYEGGAGSENAMANDLWEQAAAQGETVVVSSGDSGSDTEDQNAKYATHGLNVSGFSSTAYNVSAGGTDFQDDYNQGLGDTAYEISTFWNATNATGDSSAKSYVPETTWNDTCAGSLASYYVTGSTTPTAFCDSKEGYTDFLATGGGGGGISSINARPSFQNSTVYGLPATPAYRLLPDISLFASNGFWGHLLDYFESDVSPTALQFAGGTSFVAPQLAGVFALVDQSTGERQGQADYVLYPMAGIEYGTTTAIGACNGSGASGTGTTSALPASSCIFHDIETGNISQACSKYSPNC
jgi:subtilase family serine protease